MPVLRLKLGPDAYVLSWSGLVCSRERGARLLSVAIVEVLMTWQFDFDFSIDHVTVLII